MGLFDRKKTKEEISIEREIAYRKARSKLDNYIQKCQEMKKRYWEQGKKSAEINDKKLLRQFAAGYMTMEERVRKGNQLMLFLEGLKLKQDEVRLTTDFVGFAKEIGQATTESVNIQGIAEMQVELSKALVEAEKVGLSLDTVLSSLSETVIATPEIAEAKVSEVEKTMEGEAVSAEKEMDTKIEEKLKEIEKKMKEEA